MNEHAFKESNSVALAYFINGVLLLYKRICSSGSKFFFKSKTPLGRLSSSRKQTGGQESNSLYNKGGKNMEVCRISKCHFPTACISLFGDPQKITFSTAYLYIALSITIKIFANIIERFMLTLPPTLNFRANTDHKTVSEKLKGLKFAVLAILLYKKA